MRLAEPDESGRCRAVPLEGDVLAEVPCDRVLLALGQAADLSVLPEGAEIVDGRVVDASTDAPLFVGGDLAIAEGTVAAGVGSGRRAAACIDALLAGRELAPAEPGELAGTDVVDFARFPRSPQHRGALAPLDERRTASSRCAAAWSTWAERTRPSPRPPAA